MFTKHFAPPPPPPRATPLPEPRQVLFWQLSELCPPLPFVNTPLCRSNGSCCFRPICDFGFAFARGGGMWTAKTVKRPLQQPAQPQHANYRAPLTRKRHIPPHPAQPQHTNYWAPRTRKRHPQEHRPQRPSERSDPTQHAEGRTGDCPGPRKETTFLRVITIVNRLPSNAHVQATPRVCSVYVCTIADADATCEGNNW